MHLAPRTHVVAAAAALIASLSAAASSARAAYFFEFGQPNYVAGGNASVSVQVFLRETTTTNLATLGLIAGDVRVLFNEPTRIAGPAQATGVTPNPAFDSPAPSQPAIVAATATTSGSAIIIQSSFFEVTSGTGRVLLGTFAFQTSTTGGVTQLRAVDQSASADGLVLGNGTVIDAQVTAGTATITTTVPEPETLALAGLAAVVARRRR